MSGQLTKQFKNKIINVIKQHNRAFNKQIKGWVAVDADGDVYAFENKPKIFITDRVWYHTDPSLCRYIGSIDKFDSTRWTKAIIHTDEVYYNSYESSLVFKVWKPGKQTLVIQIQKAINIPFDGIKIVKTRGSGFVDDLCNHTVLYINPSRFNSDMVMVYPNTAQREKVLFNLIQTLKSYYSTNEMENENDGK